jgi:integrase
VFKILTDRAGLISNPWEKVQRKERDGLTRHELTDTDIKKLMASFEDPEKNAGRHPEYKTLFLIGRWTGMRLGDCCTLKWDKVDLAEEMIETIPGKTARINRKVMVPIFPELLAVLQKCAVGKTGDYVLPHLAAEYTKYEMGVKREVVDIFNATGFKTTQKLANRQRATSILGFHSFRGSLTTKLLDKGVPFHIVKDIIGDNIATLEAHYTKTNRAKVQAAAKKIKF